MQKKFFTHLLQLHQRKKIIPSKKAICTFADNILQLILPQVSSQNFNNVTEIEVFYNSVHNDLISILTKMKDDLPDSPQSLGTHFMQQLESITELLYKDAKAIVEGDPAATNFDLVISTYPGFFAIAIFRIAHALYQLNIPYLPRFLTEFAHSKTGVDIHPGAKIGEYFFIDHGTGIVIGETTIIGDHVKLYQGVTLGALSVEKSMARIKRHPTIEDYVVIYAGATILGGNTVVGKSSIIGGNVWLTESVPVYSKVYHNPQIQVKTSEDPSGLINFSI